jgi:hypothetical protein
MTQDASITRETAIDKAAEHIAQELAQTMKSAVDQHVCDGWPSGAFRFAGESYGSADEPVWAVYVPMGTRVGASFFVCVTKAEGRVVFSGFAGE